MPSGVAGGKSCALVKSDPVMMATQEKRAVEREKNIVCRLVVVITPSIIFCVEMNALSIAVCADGRIN